jgi:hypothetical protein
VSYSARGDAACPTDPRSSPAPGTDPAELGQAILAALLTAGLALNSALTMIPDGPAAAQVSRAIDELDAAVKELPHLVHAIPRPAAGASRAGLPVQEGGTVPPSRPPPAQVRLQIG